MFYFKYGQKITRRDVIGIITVSAAVLLVGIGGAAKPLEEGKVSDPDNYTFNFIASIIFPIIAAFSISMMYITVKYSQDNGFDVT